MRNGLPERAAFGCFMLMFVSGYIFLMVGADLFYEGLALGLVIGWFVLAIADYNVKFAHLRRPAVSRWSDTKAPLYYRNRMLLFVAQPCGALVLGSARHAREDDALTAVLSIYVVSLALGAVFHLVSWVRHLNCE